MTRASELMYQLPDLQRAARQNDERLQNLLGYLHQIGKEIGVELEIADPRDVGLLTLAQIEQMLAAKRADIQKFIY